MRLLQCALVNAGARLRICAACSPVGTIREIVNRRLEVVLSTVESEVLTGAIVTVEDDTVRCRLLPIT